MHLVHVIRGLIPAHAGKTRPPWPGGHGSPAHPRSRGENASSSMPIKSAYGSSPLTRGKHVATPSWAARPRLIPAHAGDPPPTFGRSRVGAGSSPLTRGKRTHLLQLCFITRLTPAHAGKTLSALAAGLWKSAHPRSRGENVPLLTKYLLPNGSSPLTRGKLRLRGFSCV